MRFRSAELLVTVDRACEVEGLGPDRCSSDAGYICGEGSVDNGLRGRCGGDVRRGERESPGRSAVPKILDGRVVIERYPPGEGFSEQFVFLVGIADVGVVPAKVIILHRVSHLHETAYVTPPCASKEQGNILRQLELAILRGRLTRFRGRVRRVDHYCTRSSF